MADRFVESASSSLVIKAVLLESLNISQSNLGGLVDAKLMEVIYWEVKAFPSLSLSIYGYWSFSKIAVSLSTL